jgi:glycosyltransferase involved in cell wall biosynthesis
VLDANLPLVTVVTPSYNQGRFIAATIESVLGQDYPNLEYLIIDGASTDETATVVAPYADRLTFVSEPDRGQSDAINKGFRRARGEIVAWLNSDDLFLPGAISAAVAALTTHPDAGAVYGEGFQIDEGGAVISRFAATRPFNLWRLLNLSDYILQQTVFFRRSIFDEVGWIDEDLYYGMDWEILMRIGLHRPLVYVPHDMGAIREYATAKSFAGGAKRARELARILRRATGKRFPPGMFVYGLPTYERITNERVGRVLRGPLASLAPRVQRRITQLAHRAVGRILREAQGWYDDGWAGRRAEFTFPAPRGRHIALSVELPSWAPITRQEVELSIGGVPFARESFGRGAFVIPVLPPRSAWEAPVTIVVRARTSFVPARTPGTRRDRRRLCYLLRSFDFETPQHGAALNGARPR